MADIADPRRQRHIRSIDQDDGGGTSLGVDLALVGGSLACVGDSLVCVGDSLVCVAPVAVLAGRLLSGVRGHTPTRNQDDARDGIGLAMALASGSPRTTMGLVASGERGDGEKFATTSAALRRRLATLALEVARVEDDLAVTLDRLAKRDPDRADELHARAAAARHYAEIERETARRYDD